jgi:hypothetical protein
MANKNFSQFVEQITLQNSDYLVGYRTAASNGELKTSVTNLFDAPVITKKPWSAKAWVAFNASSGGATIVKAHNVFAVTRVKKAVYTVSLVAGIYTSGSDIVAVASNVDSATGPDGQQDGVSVLPVTATSINLYLFQGVQGGIDEGDTYLNFLVCF